MICKHCGAEMPFFAAVCPVCEKERERDGRLQRAALILLAGCLLLGVLLFAIKALPKPEPTAGTPAAALTAETTAAPRTTNAPETTVVPQKETEVYVTVSGTKYHKSDCSYLRSSKVEMTLDEAKKQGYTPCSRCYREAATEE